MASIEDILNGSCSDEDADETFDSNGIDLELLLQGDDDEEDYNDGLIEAHIESIAIEDRGGIASGKVCTAAEQKPTDSATNKESSGSDGNNHDLLDRGTEFESADDIIKLYIGEDEPKSEYMPQAEVDRAANGEDSEQSGLKQLTSLMEADIREKRFIAFNRSKDTVSALQAKRNKSIITVYSNVKCTELGTISTHLKRNAGYKNHGPGEATATAVSSKYIAVGTSKGLLILFDHKEEIRHILGSAASHSSGMSSSAPRPASPVTAIDVSYQQGVLLVCGYAAGEVALWDTTRATLLKVVSGLHAESVSFVAFSRSCGELLPSKDGFTGGSSASQSLPSSMSIISADASGVLHQIRLSRSVIWTSLSVDSDCLLDGTSGRILGCTVLAPFPHAARLSSNSITNSTVPSVDCGSFLRYCSCWQFLAMSVGNYSWIVQVAPSISVLHKWKLPEQYLQTELKSNRSILRSGVSCCIDWGWLNDHRAAADHSAAAWQPGLARSVSTTVEILSLGCTAAEGSSSTPTAGSSLLGVSTASFSFLHSTPATSTSVSSTSVSSAAATTTAAATAAATNRDSTATAVKLTYSVKHRATFPDCSFWSIKWLGAEQLVMMTCAEIVVVNHALIKTEQFTLPVGILHPLQSAMRAEPTDADTALRAAAAGRQLFVSVGTESVFKVQVQSCFELADGLINAGQWLEALALVLEHVSKAPALLESNRGDVEKYITKYVELAVKQPAISSVMPAALSAPSSLHLPTAAPFSALSRNHYHLVAGVCIEYCIAAQSLDLLFGKLFSLFTTARHEQVFLESLEPYILSREITVLPTRIIQEFCEGARQARRLPSIERCVAYFDVASMDLDFVCKFLHENDMHSSFLYAYSNGLDDYVGAFQIVFDAAVRLHQGISTSSDSHPSPEEADVCYKLLLFLWYSFQGKLFPRGCEKPVNWERVVVGLVVLLSRERLQEAPQAFSAATRTTQTTRATTAGITPLLQESYPYLMLLIRVDPKALLTCLAMGVAAVQNELNRSNMLKQVSGAGGSGDVQDMATVYFVDPPLSAERIDELDGELSHVYDRLGSFCAAADAKFYQDRYLEALFFDTFLDLIAAAPCRLSQPFLDMMIQCCDRHPNERRHYYEMKLCDIAQQQARLSFDSSGLRKLLRSRNFWIASLSAKRSTSSSTSAAGKNPFSDYRQALQFYISLSIDEKISEPVSTNSGAGADSINTVAGAGTAVHRSPVRGGTANSELQHSVFRYIQAEFLHLTDSVDAGAEAQRCEVFPAEVLRILSRLCEINFTQSQRIVCMHLADRVPEVIANTQHDSRTQFKLLEAVVAASSYGVVATSAHLSSMAGDSSQLSLKETFTPQTLLSFFKLLCEFKPSAALDFLITNQDAYDVNECMLICKEKGLSEATAFLTEKAGDPTEALVLLLKDFSQKLKLARRDMDAQLRLEFQDRHHDSVHGSSSINSSGSAYDGGNNSRKAVSDKGGDVSMVSQILSLEGSAKAELASRLHAYQQLASVVHCAADLCARHSNASSAEGMWFLAFDHLLQERHMLRSGIVSSSGEVVVVLVGLMLQVLMNKMLISSSIPPQDIIQRVTAQQGYAAAGMRLGEFKDVMANMLRSNTHELLQHVAINNLIYTDVVELHRQKLLNKRKYVYRGSKISSSKSRQSAANAGADAEHPPEADALDDDEQDESGWLLRSSLLGNSSMPNNFAAELQPATVRAIPWKRSKIKSEYKQRKAAVEATNSSALETALPDFSAFGGGMDASLLSSDYLEPRRPGSLDVSAVYFAQAELLVRPCNDVEAR